MKLMIFAIQDTKVGAYMQPFFMRSSGEAVRALAATVADPSTQMSRTPEDFAMYQLGVFDDTTGEIESIGPVVVETALNVRKEQ